MEVPESWVLFEPEMARYVVLAVGPPVRWEFSTRPEQAKPFSAATADALCEVWRKKYPRMPLRARKVKRCRAAGPAPGAKPSGTPST